MIFVHLCKGDHVLKSVLWKFKGVKLMHFFRMCGRLGPSSARSLSLCGTGAMRAVVLTDVAEADGLLSASFHDKKVEAMQEMVARAGVGVKISCQNDTMIAELLPEGDPDTAGAFLSKHFKVEKFQETSAWMEVDKCCALGSAEKGPATDAVEVPESIDKSPAVRPNVPTGAGASSVLGEVKLRGCMVKLHNRGHFPHRPDARAYIEPFKRLGLIWVEQWYAKHKCRDCSPQLCVGFVFLILYTHTHARTHL